MANADSSVQSRLVGLLLTELTGIGSLAFLLYFLQVSGAANLTDIWATDRVVAYLLLLVAPLFIFVPFSAVLRLGPLWLLGTASWATLGYVLIFTRPSADGQSPSIAAYAAFLTILFIALSSAFAVPMGALGRWLLTGRSPLGWAASLRQGALISLFAVGLLAMSPLGVLNWLNVFLLFIIVALVEFFFLVRA